MQLDVPTNSSFRRKSPTDSKFCWPIFYQTPNERDEGGHYESIPTQKEKEEKKKGGGKTEMKLSFDFNVGWMH